MRYWTIAEDRILRKHYVTDGPRGEWRSKIPDRSDSSVAHRARILGLRVKGAGRPPTVWTAEEDVVLCEHYGRYGSSWDGWRELLPTKSPEQIGRRAKRLGVCRDADGGPAWRRTTKVTTDAWTDAQRVQLVSAMHEMCDRTGHTVMECMREFWRVYLVRKGVNKTQSNGSEEPPDGS